MDSDMAGQWEQYTIDVNGTGQWEENMMQIGVWTNKGQRSGTRNRRNKENTCSASWDKGSACSANGDRRMLQMCAGVWWSAVRGLRVEMRVPG